MDGGALPLLLKGICAKVGDEDSLPFDVKNDMEDLQSKCATCLGTFIGNLVLWQVSSDVWKDLRWLGRHVRYNGTNDTNPCRAAQTD